MNAKRKSFNIALVCDFFYPNVGGVESHIYQLALHLELLGHKIIIISHQYAKKDRIRSGVRYMKQNIKVFYIPMKPVYNNAILLTFFGTFPILREIFIRESIELVHGHSAFSPLALEALLHASTMGLRTVFTDHSLFGFADLSSILANKGLEFGLAHVDKSICVSFTSKENMVLRAKVDPHDVYVIPHGIDSTIFTPDLSQTKPETINIVVISRLVYRKGTDLLCLIIPPLCHAFPYLEFTIGGDGPKFLELEEIRERNKLQDRVHLIGSVPQQKVRDVLVTGDLFLNTSLTEAFCIAIIEAVACGLKVVSTKVGGVVEVLPSDMIELSLVSASELASCLALEIEKVMKEKREMSLKERTQVAMSRHNRVKAYYNWNDVARRTEVVYKDTFNKKQLSLNSRLNLYMEKLGRVFGKVMALYYLLHYFIYYLLCLFKPARKILRINASECNKKDF